MNRSTSYFATASAIRSAPSTWTSSNEKFLELSDHHPAHLVSSGRILCRIIPANKVVDDVGMAHTLLDRLSVSQVVFLPALAESWSCL